MMAKVVAPTALRGEDGVRGHVEEGRARGGDDEQTKRTTQKKKGSKKARPKPHTPPGDKMGVWCVFTAKPPSRKMGKKLFGDDPPTKNDNNPPSQVGFARGGDLAGDLAQGGIGKSGGRRGGPVGGAVPEKQDDTRRVSRKV